MDKTSVNDSKAELARQRQEALLERRDRLLGPAYRLFYEQPLHLVHGDGVWLYDPDGNAYLDAYNNVPVVGHSHPYVVEALARQASILNTHTRYLHETVLDYAERLLATFPGELDQAMFTCSGSEANDLALRLARTYTEGTGVIVTQFAYHGGTMATAELSPALGASFRQADHVELVPAPDSYRNAGHKAGDRFAHDVEQAVARLKARGIKPAALLVDTIFSSDGVFSDPAGFLSQGVDVIRAAGGLFIADEVQPGFARTGEHMWGFEQHNLIPDIVTLGKPMGNGHPMAGLVAQSKILAVFGRDCRYFNTFGGNPVSCAAGLAVLDVIEREGLMAHAQSVGAYFRESLQTLALKHSIIGQVRGAGLFTGVELVSNRATQAPATVETTRIVNRMREKRVLISGAGPLGNVLKIRPPLPFSKENVDTFMAALDQSIGDCV